ncbi:MAG: glycosyltransferase [Nitrososphaerota archaeon]|jgi:glycosyltransferase involved in cell wall biosynthesis|nr:glycosyltransferase [Nitrososphaerota archaeon]
MRSEIHDNLQQVVTKKVLVVHPYLNDVLRGSEEVLVKILEALIDYGHEVSLLGELPSGSIFDNLLLSNIKQIPYGSEENIKPKRFQAYRRYLFGHSKLKNNLCKEVGEMDLEISTRDTMFFIGAGKKCVAYVHFPENLTRLQKPNLKHRWFWKLFYLPIILQRTRQIKDIDLLICNSPYTKDAIMDHWGRDAEVVYPPVDIKDFQPLQKEPLVVTVGCFAPNKNFEMVTQVAKQMPDVKFVIAGRKELVDPYYDKIATLKPDNVELIANATRDDVSALLGKAKIYLNSCVNEAFGISVVEAMAAGCIPVVYNRGGPKETVGSYGFLYDDVEGCVKAIGEALQSKIEISDVVERSKMFSSDVFKKNFIATLMERGFL